MKPLLVVCLLAALPAAAQKKSMALGPNKMELTLEKQDGSAWRAVDPGTVFEKDDYIRLRFKTNFSGTLFVMNQGTGGAYVQLFPRKDVGMANQVVANREYVIPASGAFRIEGPPGFDILYWVFTPGSAPTKYTPLPPPPSPADEKAFATLRPRCDDGIMRARGDCVDTSAGPQAVTSDAQLPSNLKGAAGEPSKDLVFIRKQNRSVVSAPSQIEGPVVYEFRVAHN